MACDGVGWGTTGALRAAHLATAVSRDALAPVGGVLSHDESQNSRQVVTNFNPAVIHRVMRDHCEAAHVQLQEVRDAGGQFRLVLRAARDLKAPVPKRLADVSCLADPA